MSTTIDQRVVEMQFDNRHFERNVSTTLSSLDKLKQSLNLGGAAKGLTDVGNAAKGINLSSLGNAVETVHAKFSALQVMGVTALANITNSAINAGKRITSALTIDPIKTGFQEYETQINAVQTILANTQSKGTTIDDVNGALDELNTYADKTIYNFTEMTRNIGTFTAAGVDLDKSVTSIKGIANLAAVSGSTSQQASTAMYQLSQALASGKVSLMDWNSVVNAGMGGQVFQDALKRTAKNMGKDVDGMIKKYGSFRESLTQGEWLTAEVLTETLTQLSGAYTEADLIAQGYSQSQAKEILQLAKTAEDAATKVKTFTQLWDTLKESAQSGWTQTWEILVGDFEEAKGLLTTVSDTLGAMIGKSAEARNKLLQGWKDAGGRDDLIAGLANVFKGLMNIITPIKDAFREIFPPITVEQLVKFTKGFRELTEKFIFWDEKSGPVKDGFKQIGDGISKASEHNERLKSTIDKIVRVFKGLFAIVDFGIDIIKNLAHGFFELLGMVVPVGDGLLSMLATVGDWAVNLRNAAKETDIFGLAIDKIVGVVGKGIDILKNFYKSMRETFSAGDYSGFLGFFEGLWNVIQWLGSKAVNIFSAIGDGIKAAFGATNFSDVLNSGLLAGILAGIFKFSGSLSKPFESLAGIFDAFADEDGVLGNITGMLDDVRGCFQAYQDQLQAGTLQKIAIAIGILAAAIFVISTIDSDALDESLGAITILFTELLGAMAIFSKMSGDLKGIVKASTAMISMSAALLILSAAMKIMSTLSWDEILIALGGVVVSIGAMVVAIKKLPDKKVASAANGMIKMSVALLILSAALKVMGSMSIEELVTGLAGIAVGLTALVVAVNRLPKDTGLRTLGMIGLAASLIILGGALKIMASMSWEEMIRGLAATAGALAAITIAIRNLPKDAALRSAGMIGIATAMVILGGALKVMGSMNNAELITSLAAMGVALLELSYAMKAMQGSVAGAAAMIIAAGALAIIAPVLKTLGSMGVGEIVKSLVTLAAAFTIIGVAAWALAPMVPVMLSLAGAMALFGLATVGIGAGILAISAGFTALATAGTAGATAFVAALSIIIVGIVDLIPLLVEKMAGAIVAICEALMIAAPKIAETLAVIITEVLATLVTYTPQIVESLMQFVIGVLDAFAANLPQLIVSTVNVIGAFFQGIVDALSGMDTTSLLKGIVGVGLLAALMFALSAVASLVPGAMMGVIGMGVIIAELALVLAAIGAIAQIPGLSWLIEEGGQFLQTIGTAIGQFIGGIVGGFMGGMSSSFPQIGSDLSAFMTNLQPFIEGAKNLDPTMLDSVRALADTILILTAANILEGLTSWATGGSSLAGFGEQLGSLGTSLNTFATNLGTFDESKLATITCAANAIKILAQAAEAIPNEGGWAAKIFGDNSIATFGEKLPTLASNLNAFATNLGTFDETKLATVTCAANAIKALAQSAESLPNEGGWAAKIFGDNSLATFGEQLPTLGSNLGAFATNLGTFDETKATTITCAANAIKAFANAAQGIDGQADWAKKIFGDNGLASFSDQFGPLGTNLNAFATNVGTFDEGKVATINSAVKAIKALSGLANADLEGAKKNMGGFGDKLADFGSDLKTFTNDMPSPESINSAVKGVKDILSVIDDIANANSGALATFANDLKKIGEDAVDKFVKAFTSSDAKSAAEKGAKDLADKIVDGIESKEKAAETAGENLADKAVDGLDGLDDDAESAGKDLGSGLVRGIKAKYQAAYDAGYALGQKAVQGEKDGQASNSPSKLTIQAGKWLGEGLIVGMAKIGRKVYESGSELGSNATDSISATVSKIADIMSSDIDAQPTIRPVLDLSNVRTGVDAIDDMFGIGSTVGVLANANAIGASMNRRGQNGGNEEIVSAIDKLRKDLANVGNTSYHIEGITYDDGSNISTAVQDIVRAARIGRRV